MASPPGWTWRRRLLACGIGTCLGLLICYIALNLLFVSLVPILHHFTFTIEVAESDTHAPIEGATLSWQETNPRSGRERFDPVGATGANGRLVFTETIQRQPLWMLPKIGSFDFSKRVLHAAAVGYEDRVLRVAEVLPDVPYANPEGAIRISLHRVR